MIYSPSSHLLIAAEEQQTEHLSAHICDVLLVPASLHLVLLHLSSRSSTPTLHLQSTQFTRTQERTPKKWWWWWWGGTWEIGNAENQDPGMFSPLISQMYFSINPALALSFQQLSWADAQTFTAHKISAGRVVSSWVTAEMANISQPQIPVRWFTSTLCSRLPSRSPRTSL